MSSTARMSSVHTPAMHGVSLPSVGGGRASASRTVTSTSSVPSVSADAAPAEIPDPFALTDADLDAVSGLNERRVKNPATETVAYKSKFHGCLKSRWFRRPASSAKRQSR